MSVRQELLQNKRGFWLFIPLLLIYACSYFQRTALPGTIYNTLVQELGFNAAQMATLGASFVYTYAVFQLISGALVDRFCGARVVVAGGLVFIAGTILFPLCHSTWMLYLARMLTGIGASTMYLSLVRETDRIFGRKNYAVFFGIAYFCGYGGGLIGSLPFELLCQHFPWRHVLLTAAGLGFVVYLLFLYGKSKVSLPPIPKNSWSLKPFKRILGNPLSWLVILCSGVNFCTYFIIQTVFGKKFLEDFAGYSSANAALVIFILTLVCMFTMLTASFLTRLTGNRRRPLVLAACGICAASSLLMTAAIYFRFPGWVFGVIYCLFAAAAGIPPIFTMVMQEVNSRDVMAQAAAVSNMFGYLAVAVCSQLIGMLLDSFDKKMLPSGAEIYSPEAYLVLFCIVSVISASVFAAAWKLPETKGHYLHPYIADKE